MADFSRPRNIRDIAHLYLSRSSNPRPASVVNLFLTASTRNCLPGFHTANIAAAMAARVPKVRVFELSGLLPNVAFYFAHQPPAYLGSDGDVIGEFSPGLNMISVAFDPVRLMSEHGEETRVNVIHLPPADESGARGELMRSLKGCVSGERWALYLDGGEESRPSLDDQLDARLAFTLRLTDRGGPPETGERSDLGWIAGWADAVRDRLPAVVRNPRSRLSRQYLAVCESMLGRIHSMRRQDERSHERVEQAR